MKPWVYLPFTVYINLCHCFLQQNTINRRPRPSLGSSLVQVDDNVFSPEACVELHLLAQEHTSRSRDGSSIFFRDDTSELTPIEHALNSYLTAVGDPHEIVEYWSRDEYLNIDAHTDVDELELEEDRRIRCPEFGHVLYLIVDPEVRAPTCVFPTKLGGWTEGAKTELVTVPAVQGRVLRFSGSAMHAVPKPADRFLLSEEQERIVVENQVLEEEDVDEESGDIDRSVILFNTWSREGPRGVAEDYSEPSLPQGIELDDSNSFQEISRSQRVEVWEEDYAEKCSDLWCRPSSQWRPVDIIKDRCLEKDSAVRVPLMGWKVRRLYPKKKVHLQGSSALTTGLSEARQPRSFQLLEGP